MIDILIGIGILSLFEAAFIFVLSRLPFKSESALVDLIGALLIVLAITVGLLILIAVISLACAFIARSLPEFAEMLTMKAER